MTAAPAGLADFRREFASLRDWRWFATPGVCPGAATVTNAMDSSLQTWGSGDFSWLDWEARADTARGAFASLVGAALDDVALMGSLAEAAATVAGSLRAGRVVVPAQEFRSNLFPWLALRARGVEVVLVDVQGAGTAGLVDAIVGGTSLVAFSDVQSDCGLRLDAQAVVDAAHAVGAKAFVNLTQSLGVLQFDAAASGADYVACHGYKWLLCPRGAAFLYVRPDRLRGLEPLLPSWKSGPAPYDAMYGSPLEYAASTRRLDASLAWPAWWGAAAAFEVLSLIEPGLRERLCLDLASVLRGALASAGADVVAADLPSHVVAIRTGAASRLVDLLSARKIAVTARGNYLRLGIHAFNTEEDVDAVVSALSSESGKSPLAALQGKV